MSGVFELKGRILLAAATLLLCVVAAPGRAAVSAIEEYYPGDDAVNPWGLKLVRDFDGTLTTYKYNWNAAGNFVTTEDRGGGATPNSQTVVAGVETVTEVNSAGMVVSETKTDIASGQTISAMKETQYQDTTPFPSTYTYTQPLATTESYSYDGEGNVLSHTDQLGHTTNYTYDALYRLTGATRDNLTWTVNYSPGTSTSGDTAVQVSVTDTADTRTWKEEKSPFGEKDIQTVTGPYNVMTTRTETPTDVTTTKTDSTTHRNITDYTTKSDRSGYVTGYGVDSQWISRSYSFTGSGWSETVNLGSLMQKTVYNAAGQVVEEDRPSPSGSGMTTTTITQDPNDWQVTEKDPDGQSIYTLLPDGEVGSESRKDGASGQTRSTTLKRDSVGSAIQWTWTDATGETVWRRTYDTSTGVTVDYPWGDNAKAFTTTPSLSGDQFTLETKDGNGMVDDVQTLADGAPHGGSFTGAGVSQSWNATTNNYGEATSVASMLGGSAGPTETYSKFGLPETISGVAGMATTTFSAWVNPFTSTGILNLSTMTNGHTSRWRTSPMGWPLTTGGYGEPWVNLQPPSFGSGISQSFSVNSASGTSQTLDYNPGSTMQERVFADGKTESFGYTDGGAAKSWTTPGGSTQNFWPNAYGQSTRQGSLAWKIGYDLAGRLSTVTDAAGTHGYKYYEGQLDTEWHSGGPNNGGWVWHGYDSAGRLKTVKLSDGSSCSYTYNTDGTLDTVTTVGGSTGTWSSYDAATGRAQSFAIGSMTVSSGYDLNGHPTSAVSAAGGYTSTYSYTYNGDGNCSSVTAPDGSWNIGYDSYGNLYSASSNVGGTNYTYSWDAAGRPSGASSYLSGTRTNSSSVVVAGSVTPGATVTINGSAVTPDANGGFSLTNSDPSIQNTWQTYTVQAMLAGAGNNGTAAVAQQVKKVFVPPTTETLGSDGNDNRASDARWTYSWNDYGQLTDANDAKSGGNTDIAFTYDYMGRMVQRVKSVSGAVVSTTTTLYDGWKPALQIDYGSTGGETARRIYTWGPDVSGAIDGAAGIGGLIEMVERKGGVTTKSLALNDGIGNVVGMVDESNGSRLATYSYGPFGEPVSATGPKMADCPLRWQTKLYDEDLGLCYFGKRWYDPKTRTWISPDPLREGGGVNVAEAFRNQPLNYVDPTGGKPIPMIGDDLRRAQEQGGFFGLMGATPAAIWNLMNPFDPTSPASTGRQKFSSEILPQGLANLDAMNMPSFLKTVIKANIGLGIAGNNFNPLNGAVGLYDAGTTVVRIGPVAAGKQLIKSIHDQPAVFAGGLPLIFIGGEESLVAESLEDASTAGEVVETAPTEFQIIQYGDKAFGFQNHHGVMDKWATENVPGYASRDSYGPSIRLSIANHNATRTVFTDFSKKLTGKPVGKIDWQGMSPQTAQELSERMFDAANVPAEARAAYYRAFNRYIYTGEW